MQFNFVKWAITIFSSYSFGFVPLQSDFPTLGQMPPEMSVLFSRIAKGPSILFFFPKAGTKDFRIQVESLKRAWPELQKYGVQSVVGISSDKVEDLERFKNEWDLPFTFLSDPSRIYAKIFHVPGQGAFNNRELGIYIDGKLVYVELRPTGPDQGMRLVSALRSLQR